MGNTQKVLAGLIRENKALRQALAFYAPKDSLSWRRIAGMDRGHLARVTLENCNGKPK